MKTFKDWFSNSDMRVWMFITLIFWTMLFVGIFYSDVPKSIVELNYGKTFGDVVGFIMGNIFGSVVVIGVSIGLPIYILKSWIRFKKTGKVYK